MRRVATPQQTQLSTQRHSTFCARLALVWLIVLASCGRSEEAIVEPTEPAAEAAPEPVKVDPIPGLVEDFAASVHPQITTAIVEELALKQLRATIKQTKAERYDPYHYRSVLRTFYLNGDKGKLFFFRGAQLSDVGMGTLKALKEAKHHGLDVKAYHLRRIDKVQGKLMALVLEQELDGDRITLTKGDRKRAEALLRAGVVDPSDPDIMERLLKALLQSKRSSRALVEARNKARKRLQKQARYVAEIEADLADAFVRYAWDMHFRNPVWFDLPDFEGKLEDEQHAMLLDNMRKVLSKTIHDVDIPSHMRELIPKNAAYWRLLPVLASTIRSSNRVAGSALSRWI
ncbi:MAG: hypothetical protein AAFS10_14630 [Myxococcota bacterium]